MIEKFRNSVTCLLYIVLLSIFSMNASAQTTIDDVSQLNKTKVSAIRTPVTEEDIQQAIFDANRSKKRISIAGSKHSQGGHIMIDDAIVLDMTDYDKIIALDEAQKLLTVESGTTWAQIQSLLNERNLSVKVQQSSNIFTVGGSISANIHGRDPRFGPIIETVRSFRLIKADGSIINVSRIENPELFSLVIGGYGLFGVVSEVTLEVTDNNLLQKSTQTLKCSDYPAFLKNSVLTDAKIELHYARPDIRKSNFMNDCSVSSFRRITYNPNQSKKLKEEKYITISKWLLNLSRKSSWGKSIRWKMQDSILDKPGKIETITRNNAMRPPVKFLEYYSSKDTDVLQEYFIPIDHASDFMERLKKIALQENVNLLSITLRYLKANNESLLSYSSQDFIAMVLYINHGKDKKSLADVQNWTQKLIDAALNYDGTYYLTYANYASDQQIQSAYPQLNRFIEHKKYYDPNALFLNKFYKHYNLQ